MSWIKERTEQQKPSRIQGLILVSGTTNEGLFHPTTMKDEQLLSFQVFKFI